MIYYNPNNEEHCNWADILETQIFKYINPKKTLKVRKESFENIKILVDNPTITLSTRAQVIKYLNGLNIPIREKGLKKKLCQKCKYFYRDSNIPCCSIDPNYLGLADRCPNYSERQSLGFGH